jgi:hypothetical protein
MLHRRIGAAGAAAWLVLSAACHEGGAPRPLAVEGGVPGPPPVVESAAPGPPPVVMRTEDIAAADGRAVEVVGVYRGIPVPTKGPRRDDDTRPKEYAIIMLDGGGSVYLEPFATRAAIRSEEERSRFDGRKVRVTGTLHKIMPATGQSLLAPCVAGVRAITLEP